MKHDKHQRQAYAIRRTSRAVDRAITAQDETEKAQAKKWAVLWGRAAGFSAPTAARGR